MLDDLKYIHQRDASDALGLAEKQGQQLLRSFNFSWSPKRSIKEVIVAGMGGSGLAAKAYQYFGGLTVPFSVLQDYCSPRPIGEGVLIVCSSYSGNTEEVLGIFEQAIELSGQSGPEIVVVASGGKLLARAQELGLPYLVLPGGYQPRFTFGYQYRALVEIFTSAGLTNDSLQLLEKAAHTTVEAVSGWLPDVVTSNNLAKQIALDSVGKAPVVYSSLQFYPAAYKWKISFNENAKNIAWCNHLPEFSHNEFLGWSSQPLDKLYLPIFFHSSFDHPQIIKRVEATKKLLSGKLPPSISVTAEGESAIEQLFWLVALGDFVSLYLALLNNLDPTPVELIEKLKKELV